jgi:hypothetical protein
MNGGANSGAGVQITLTATPTVYSVAGTVSVVSQHYLWIMPASFLAVPVATGSQTLTATKFQLNDITGETDQTTIRPYVSVGVESAPAYHGSMIDGVKCFDTDRLGNPISTSGSYPIVGYVPWEARTNSLLHARDLSNAAWVKVNCTGIKDAVGSDGVTNSASTMTATGAAATCLQTIVLAAAARSYSVKLKRKTGTGTVSICRDGVTFTDITAQINSSTYTTVKIENTSVLNPICGIKLATSGDAVYVDWNQDEAGAFSTPSIDTTTLAVARNADVLTYPSAGNISGTAGTVYAEVTTAAGQGTNQNVISRSTTVGGPGVPLYLESTNTVNIYDGAGIATKAAATRPYTTSSKLASTWGGSTMATAQAGVVGTAAAFDGDLSVAPGISIGSDSGITGFLNGNIRNIRIWNRKLSNSELQAITA